MTGAEAGGGAGSFQWARLVAGLQVGQLLGILAV